MEDINIVWLASYPRSGNTWFRILWRHYTGLPTFSAHADAYSNQAPLSYKFGPYSGVEGKDPDVYLTKTHYQPPPDDFPVIAIIRDGRDVAVSYYHYLQEIDNNDLPDEILQARIAEGKIIFGSWEGWTRYWLIERKRPVNIVWTFNELLKLDPVEIIERSILAIGQPLDLSMGLHKKIDCPPPGFGQLNQEDPKFFRRGTHRQWCDPDYTRMTSLFTENQGEGLDFWDRIREVPPEMRGHVLRPARYDEPLKARSISIV